MTPKNSSQTIRPITVFGSVNWDMMSYLEHLPAPGETISALSFDQGLGGKGANQAVSANQLSRMPVKFVAAIGDDIIGSCIQTALERFGVQADDLVQVQGTPSGLALIQIEKSGQNTISIVGGANHFWTAKWDYAPYFAHDHIVLFQQETPLRANLQATKTAKNLGAFVILDPAPASEQSTAELIPYADIVTPNEVEAKLITGIEPSNFDEGLRATTKLLALGAPTAIVKLGAKGVVFKSKSGEEGVVPSFAVEAVDTVGAGDIFNGALAVALQEEHALDAAIRFASVASALSVTKKGASSSAPTRNEVDDFLNAHS